MNKFLVWMPTGELLGTVDAWDSRSAEMAAMKRWGVAKYDTERVCDHDDTRGIYHPEDDAR